EQSWYVPAAAFVQLWFGGWHDSAGDNDDSPQLEDRSVSPTTSSASRLPPFVPSPSTAATPDLLRLVQNDGVASPSSSMGVFFLPAWCAGGRRLSLPGAAAGAATFSSETCIVRSAFGLATSETSL